MKTANRSKILLALLSFNALSAIAGGLHLVAAPTSMPLDMLKQTVFPNYYVPGVILFAIVGGSSLIAAAAHYKKVVGHELAALVSAVIMLAWIAGEIASIHQFHGLQVIYIVTALAILTLAGE